MDIKPEAYIAVAVGAVAITTAAVVHKLRKEKPIVPLPGTTKAERLVIIKTKKK